MAKEVWIFTYVTDIPFMKLKGALAGWVLTNLQTRRLDTTDLNTRNL